jgi:hypothetical protein
MIVGMVHLLEDVKKIKTTQKTPKAPKVSIIFLKACCEYYYLEFTYSLDKERHMLSGMYKDILISLEHNYSLFEELIKNYVQITRALTLIGYPQKYPSVFNLHYFREHLILFRKAEKIINSSNDNIGYITIARKLEERRDID